jgi:hypothetical protein
MACTHACWTEASPLRWRWGWTVVVEAAVEWALADYVDTLPGGKADQRLRGAVGAWERQG